MILKIAKHAAYVGAAIIYIGAEAIVSSDWGMAVVNIEKGYMCNM